MFVFGGYFGGCLKVARGRPSVRERGNEREVEDLMVRRRVCARAGARSGAATDRAEV